MKSIKFFFACVLALTFVACSNAESDSFEDNTSNFESMKSLYGIESAAYDPKAEEIPGQRIFLVGKLSFKRIA